MKFCFSSSLTFFLFGITTVKAAKLLTLNSFSLEPTATSIDVPYSAVFYQTLSAEIAAASDGHANIKYVVIPTKNIVKFPSTTITATEGVVTQSYVVSMGPGHEVLRQTMPDTSPKPLLVEYGADCSYDPAAKDPSAVTCVVENVIAPDTRTGTLRSTATATRTGRLYPFATVTLDSEGKGSFATQEVIGVFANGTTFSVRPEGGAVSVGAGIYAIALFGLVSGVLAVV